RDRGVAPRSPDRSGEQLRRLPQRQLVEVRRADRVKGRALGLAALAVVLVSGLLFLQIALGRAYLPAGQLPLPPPRCATTKPPPTPGPGCETTRRAPGTETGRAPASPLPSSPGRAPPGRALERGAPYTGESAPGGGGPILPQSAFTAASPPARIAYGLLAPWR